MIARGLERVGQPPEDPLAVVEDLRRLAVHHARRPHHLAAKGLPDRLVPEADAQDGDLAGVGPDHVQADSGLVGGAGAGRDHQVRGRQGADVAGRDLVVADHPNLRTNLAEVLDQVVGERVVIIDDQQHVLRPVELVTARAISTAFSTARALMTHSRCSSPGTLSATMPAPACTWMVSPSVTSVRMAMARSALPAY